MTDPATKPVQITPEHASENPAQYGGMPKLTGRILWICGIALLLAGQFYIHTSEPLPARILLAAGTAVVIIACLGRFRFLPADPEISPRITAALLTIVILAAIPIRLYHLGTVPYGAHNDEIVKGMQVLKFFEGDGFQPFYVANKEFLFFYMLAPFVRYFGVSIIGLRALPFTCGLLTVLFTYLCIRRLWGRSAALLGAGFLAAGLWPGQSSHICERLNAAPLMTAASIFLMLLAIQSRRTAAFLLTGIVMGAGMWTFPTFRLIPWAVLAVMTIAVCAGIVPRRSGTLKVVLTAAAWVAVTSAPLKFRIAETFQVFYSRHGHDFKIAKSPEQILEYVSQLLLSFNVRCVPDMSFTLQDVPLFWWPLGAFFLAGVIYLVMHLPRFDAVVTAGWLGAALLPAVVSEPTVRRLTAAQPLVFALIGLGVWHTVTAFLPRTRGRQRWGLIPAFGVVIAAGIVNYHLFTTRIAPEWRVAREDYWIVEAVTAAFDRFEVHIDWIEEEAELPLRYLTYPETGDLNWFKAEPPAFAVPFQFNPNDDFIYFFRNIPENEPSIPVLQDVYPKGVLVLHQDAAHPRGYYSFTMRRDDLASRRGVTVRACGRSVRLPEFTIDPETLQDLQVSVACGTVTVEG
ncbi:MAG TPA: glycosyltransferase family 39 protein, partial [bacterium]|nr:glycosyltransferase family 39 protein [bacterium]